MKTPIKAGAYRLRNDEIIDFDTVSPRFAIGTIRGSQCRTHYHLKDGLFDADGGMFDPVERLDSGGEGLTPIEKGRYRLRNRRTAKVVEITTMNDVQVASGFVEGLGGDPDEAMEWNGDDGLFGRDRGPWDLVELLSATPDESVLTILRREHVAMITVADSHAAISKQALQCAQEIEHRIREMERGGR